MIRTSDGHDHDVDVHDVNYTADDTHMSGRLVLPSGTGRRPGVLVFHEASGLTGHETDSARRLAELGYVALAADYHGSAHSDDDVAMMARLEDLGSSPSRMRALGQAALAALVREPRVDATKVAAIGYCFGAVMALELAKDHTDLKAVVGFHPGWVDHDPQDSANITARVLLCIGSEDPWMPAQLRLTLEDELRAAGLDWQINLYGGAKHSFTNPAAAQSAMPEIDYHQPSDARSWRSMLRLLEETLAA